MLQRTTQAALFSIENADEHAARVEQCNFAALNATVVSQHNGDRCIELAKTTQHPFLPFGLVLTLDTHGGKQLFGNANLTLAVRTCVIWAGAKLA